jgi:hypothetical protein
MGFLLTNGGTWELQSVFEIRFLSLRLVSWDSLHEHAPQTWRRTRFRILLNSRAACWDFSISVFVL